MKKIIMLFSMMLISVVGFSKNQMVFRGDTLNIESLYPKIGIALCDSIVNNLLVDVSDGSTQRLVGGFIAKFGQQYLVDLLTGNFVGKDPEVILMFGIMNCTDIVAKLELVGRLAHERRLATVYTFGINSDVMCMGFGNGNYKMPLKGTPLLSDKTKGIVLLKDNESVAYIVDYYSVLLVK